MGIYIDTTDAVPLKPKEFSLEHFYMMTLKDKLQEYLYDTDMVKLKGALEKRNVFNGVILEEFRKGLILVVTFDDIDAINSLWELHVNNKLSPMFQDILIDGALLKAMEAKRVTIRAKLWEDEYNDSKMELLERGMDRISLDKFPNDISHLKRIKNYQRILNEDILSLRDAENDFEQNLGDFVSLVKKLLPENKTELKTLKEFNTCVKIAKGTSRTLVGFQVIDLFTNTVEELRRFFANMEENICYPLSLVHRLCESKSQREMKTSIMETVRDMKQTLSADSSLHQVKYPEWEGKILQREKKLFFGLISLIPLSIERITDVDHTMDEYITCFPQKI
ncbi:uncharacterized protein LOC121377288 isoform X2 [Gigantopelta aegis]|nr:uncharacterized protein LOC121377288 isoform X2 [Gigantopelta aegis]